MDKPTSLMKTLPRLLVGLWLTAVTASACLAQGGAVNGDGAFVPEIPASYSGSGSFFNRQLGTAFRFSYHNEGYGTQDGVVTLGSMRVFNGEGSTIFLDGQATLSDEFGGGFNAGIGYRSLSDLGFGFDSRRINGVNFWTDGQSTSADNFFTQLGVGLESLGDSVDLRFQGYFPLDRIKDGESVNVPGSTPVFEGDALLGALQQFARDTALTVVDLEGAKRIANLEAWGFLGGYHLTGGPYDATGYRAGVRGYAVPDLALSVQVTDDDIYHTNVMFHVTWFVGRTHRLNAPCGTLLDRFREPVLRNDFIATTQQLIDDPITPLTDAVSGDQFVFVHVDSSAPAGGDGSFENPYNNLLDAQNGSGENSIVFVHSGSVLAGNFMAQDGQRILGEGLNQDGDFVDHVVNSAEQGIVSLPETSPGSQMVVSPTINGVGTVFELANDNEVNNFVLNGGVTAVNANAVSAPQLANLDINSPTGDAIVFTDVTGSSLVENSVTIDDAGGRGMVVDGGSGVLGANAVITNTTNRAVEISGRGGGSVTVGEIHQTAGGEGIYVHDNTGGTITFSSQAELTTGANTAVELVDNAGTTITFQELEASADAADTVVVTGGGTISVNDPNDSAFINNTGTGSALVVRGDDFAGTGNPTVSIAADISNSGGGQAVDIQQMTGGGVTITGDVTDTDGSGMGILVQDNTAGTYAFEGHTDLDTGANSAVVLNSNTGATINFQNLTATSAAASETFRIEGGGTVTVNDPNDTGLIANTGTGSALVVRGDGLAGTGNPTVSIAADISNSGGGQAVDIQQMTGGGVTITGDVTDTDGSGMGILVQDNTAGTYAFSGNTTLTTGANPAVTLQNNTGATINFSNLIATATGGDTFSVIGGGTVNVDDPNDTAMIINDGSGTAVFVRGGVDDPTVNIAANVVNTVGGMLVDIQDMTGGGVTFTGLVDDMDGGVLIQNNTGGSFIFTDTLTVNTGNNDAVALVNNTGATLSFNGLDITATGAGAKGFTATGGGTLTVSNTNGTSVMSDMQTALELDGMAIGAGNVTFDMVNQTAGTTTGVILKDLTGTGSVTAGADPNMPGTIISSSGGILVDGGANNITINTDIETTGGESLEVINRTGGTVTFNGTINDTGTGMNIATNTGGSVNVTGDLEFDTLAGFDAITITSNNGATVNVTGSSIDFMSTADSGVHLSGTNSNVSFDPNMTGGTGDMVEVEGTATATFDGNMTNAAGHSVYVHDLAGGTVAFNGDINDTGDGVIVEDNTGGTVSFAGDVTLNTGASDAIVVQNNTGGSTSFANADIDTTSGDGVNLSSNTGASMTFQALDINTTSGNGFTATGGGTLAVTGTNTINTTTGTGLNLNGMTISGSGAAFNRVSVNGATNGITLTNLSGGQTRVGAAAATGIAGDGGTLQNTTGQAITVNGVTNAVFNDVTVTSPGADSVVVNHTTAAAATVVFDNLSLTASNPAANGVTVTDSGTGELDFTLRNSMVDVSAADTIGFMFNSGANTGEVDVRLQSSTITTGDNEAVLVNITNGTGDIQYLITNNTIENNSATDAAAAFTNTATRTLNATIGDQSGTLPYNNNSFINPNAGGTALTLETNAALSSINLDLRDNILFGGANDAVLTETLGTFGVVDRDTTFGNPSGNNNGDVDPGGANIVTDFDDLAPPIKQVD